MAATTQIRLLVRSCLHATHPAPIERLSSASISGVLVLLRRPGVQSSFDGASCRCRCTRVPHLMASEDHALPFHLETTHTSAFNFIIVCSPFSFR